MNKIDKNVKIVCGKFDSNININQSYITNEQIRIGSNNPNKLKSIIYSPIATNGQSILYQEKLYEVRDFFINTDKSILKQLIVLTIKERSLILEALVDFDLDVNVFEVKYPIFNHIKYISNIHKNYRELRRLLEKIKLLNIKGKSLGHQLSTEYLYKIERKLRFKNKLDSYFAFAYKGGYQEVFKLKEEREDRVIIAMDFNSMYVDCMMGDFIEPKSIKYKNFRDDSVDFQILKNGLYRVVFKHIKDTFFKDFHPFKYMKLNHSYYFKIEANQDIEILLFRNEIEYYMNFFEEVEIVEGFYSDKTMEHPLKKYAQRTYEERLHYKSINNETMNNLCKYKLITIHSATNSKRFKTLYFKTIESIVKYIAGKYMINFPNNMNDIEKLESIQDDNYFKFWKHNDGYKAKVINFNTYESIYSISAQIVANGRLKMIKVIEKFLEYDSVEICYSNIDSLHISILKTEVDNFLLSNKNLISNKLGDLKIETISEKGYWFDVGRYWLMSDKKVDIYKNSFFNGKNTKDEFIKNRKMDIVCKNDTFNYIKTAWSNIYKSFSYHKKTEKNNKKNIDSINFKRYTYKEIYNLDVANNSYLDETLRCKNVKVDLFNEISTV